MIDFLDTNPDVRVDAAEYNRLLGFPRGHTLEGRTLELAEWARVWYRTHGRPWIYARQATTLLIERDSIRVDDVTLRSGHVRQIFEQAGAHTAVLVAVSAGPELERHAQHVWLEQKPDEYFFLEVFGSAVVEHLTTMAGARLCQWADGEKMAVLPHYSPGYPEWDVSEQRLLLSAIGRSALPGELEVLESGMLRPKKSLLALFGVTRHLERTERLGELVPCEGCSLAGCQYRRVPYRRAGAVGAIRTRAAGAQPASAYAVSTKALRRWAAERLTLSTGADGTVDALFRYDGTTCSNMGRSLVFFYRVVLGPRHGGFVIREQTCAPAPGDEGFRAMCQYIHQGESLIETISGEKPLLGRPLGDVLSWKRPPGGAGCYCEPDDRQHKWGLVLETIHYALSQDSHSHDSQSHDSQPHDAQLPRSQ